MNATANSVLIREFSVKTGITEFSSHDANAVAAKLAFEKDRGLDFADSEWISVPNLSSLSGNIAWRAVFWTVGNHLDAKLDANTIVSKTGKVKVDLAQSTINVPWGVRKEDLSMYQFERRPGLVWKYDYAPTTEDSAYISIGTGDKFTSKHAVMKSLLKNLLLLFKIHLILTILQYLNSDLITPEWLLLL